MSKNEDIVQQTMLIEEDAPPIGRVPRVPTWKYCTYCLLFALLLSTVLLTVRVVQLEGRNETSDSGETQPAGTKAFEFPIKLPSPWNITSNLTRHIEFEVDQGTWMNLDVSSDGLIVFDHLGDLWTMNMSSPGQPSLLKGGASFDWQPRFDPTGQYLLYTSDESGSDNLWIMRLSTKQRWQFTSEVYRFITDGMWSPGGDSIIATKWYTSSRSVPAGEIWQFAVHWQGENLVAIPKGAGKKVVHRSSSTSQVGPQEPIWNVDGTSIFYCENAVDNQIWNYNKDPNQGIYGIYRYNLYTHETEEVARGTGGAARPILSHDGATLAFVRRTLFTTSLVVRDIGTGNEFVLYTGLSLDQQTSSSPHGNYPKFAFTHNDSKIIIWANGTLWSMDVNNGEAIELPFTLTVSLNIGPTTRAHPDISSGSFHVNVIQWPSVGQVGGRPLVAFTAIGRAWTKYLDDQSAPVELTPGKYDDSFQFYPTLTPAGDSYALVHWNDVSLSTIGIYNAKEGYTDIAGEIGRYADPKFCPTDSRIITYTRLGGDVLSGNSYSARAGVYIAQQTDNVWQTPVFVTSDGDTPHFSKDCTKLYVVRGEGPQSLVEITLNTDFTDWDETKLATSQYTTKIAVDPSGKYVAFLEFHQVYFTPLTPDLIPMSLSSIPQLGPKVVYKVSTNGAHWIGWDQNSSKPILRYAHGSKLYENDVEKIMSTCLPSNSVNPASSTNCIENLRTMYDLGFTQQDDTVTSASICLKNGVVLTMTDPDSSAIDPGTIVISGDKIAQVGPAATITCPSGSVEYDLQGGIVMPGFVDVHAHWDLVDTHFVQQSWQYIINLAFGVTTMHNPSADTVSVFTDRELVLSGKKLSPRIFSTGSIVYGADGIFHCEVGSLDDALTHLRRLKEYGAWSAKTYNQPARSSRQQILAAANILNMTVVPEGGMHVYWNLNQIIDGHATIEHTIPISMIYDDVIELFVRSGTAWTPTHIVNYGDLWGENYWYQHFNVWENQRLMRFANPNVVKERSVRRFVEADDRDYIHFLSAKGSAAVFQRGGIVETGAHGQMQGIGIHWEISMLNQGGLTPHQAFYAATRNGARALGIDAYLGSLEVGKFADIIVYDPSNNPINDISLSQNVKYVLRGGRMWYAENLTQIYPDYQHLPQGPRLDSFYV